MKFPQMVRDLLAAREVLVRRGWCKGQAEKAGGGACCAMGALARGATGKSFYVCSFSDFDGPRLALRAIVGDVVKFNDAENRTKAEVLAAFDAAASLALSEAHRP